jgi:hypothetical protein
MKHVIQTEEDYRKLCGKFIVQINSHEPNRTIMDMDWGFAKEKRIKFITQGFGHTDLYGNRHEFPTFERFKNWFNDYLFNHMIEKGEESGKRFHRLLTSKELDYLCQNLKEENY